ncbi:alpha/beta fold hydrolase [Spongiactinospora sp. TRM90649]|uniref:alpha/beta fold hydrolase n=1 Tax=Spongiactinospora sp. TRM90649 TaxID=3031114 RepID=UPI0023FA1C84|nr:alpha/beta fold hydrolase [Spongiactinospora sp. TRM90649]MDF5751651.1 alpha/beta fold hydrolase [Spongiactinospora sp. TRM90649]
MTPSVFADPRTIRLPGGPLCLYEAGPVAGDRPPVLLLHGAMLDTAPLIWRHLMPELARERRVVAIDMPRHGGSRPWQGTLDQPAMAAAVDGVLDHLEIGRATLAGLSMGGGVAIGYALSRPERVAALVAISPGGLDRTRPPHFLTWLGLRSDRLLRYATRWVASPSYLRRTMERQFAAGADTPDFEEVMALIEAEARLRLAHGERALDDWQITAYGPWRMRLNHLPHVHRLGVPSLWVHGVLDKAVRERSVRQAAASAPRATFVSIDRAGHLAPLERPDEVNAAVLSFLDDAGV